MTDRILNFLSDWWPPFLWKRIAYIENAHAAVIRAYNVELDVFERKIERLEETNDRLWDKTKRLHVENDRLRDKIKRLSDCLDGDCLDNEITKKELPGTFKPRKE